jgi:hypothetical protein
MDLEENEDVATVEIHERIDQFELALLASDKLIEMPVHHAFTRGMYIRQLLLPAQSINTSKVHKTQHPFVILKGCVSVLTPGQGAVKITAPYLGLTEPGTRRVVYAHEDSIWVSFHPNPDDEHDLTILESRIIERRDCADGSGRTTHEVYLERMAEQAAELEAELAKEVTS